MNKGKFIIYNGDIISAEKISIKLNNRSFLYGDGLFETLRAFAIYTPLLKYNFERLIYGLKILEFKIPSDFTFNFIEEKIQRLIKANKFFVSSKIKIIIYRKDNGLYLPQCNEFDFIIENYKLEEKQFTLNTTGLFVDVYNTYKKPILPYLQIKSNQALLYILGAIWAKNRKIDDALILNTNNHIIEATSSNIFYVKDNIIYTPPLDDGCVAGTMRRFIEEIHPEIKFKTTTQDDLLNADEIFLTNAIAGVKWVAGLKEKRYFNSTSRQLIEAINKEISKITS
ncbi:MAG: aminotransferase class IV [Bacteroidales bacterium]|nr:aminotransferase class IV [Bacteroidales bacterium]